MTAQQWAFIIAGEPGQSAQWLRKVPLTATPGFKAEAGRILWESPYPEFRRIGQQMLDGLNKSAPRI